MNDRSQSRSIIHFCLILLIEILNLDKSGGPTDGIHRATLLAWQRISCHVAAPPPPFKSAKSPHFLFSRLSSVISIISGFHFLHNLKKMHKAFTNHPSGLLSIPPTPEEMGAPVFSLLFPALSFGCSEWGKTAKCWPLAAQKQMCAARLFCMSDDGISNIMFLFLFCFYGLCFGELGAITLSGAASHHGLVCREKKSFS